MTFNSNSNLSTNSDDPNSINFGEYNWQAPAGLISSFNEERVIPLQVLQAYFPSLFENRNPNVNSPGDLSWRRAQASYQPPNNRSRSFSGSNGDVNSNAHNGSTGGNQWSNGQVQNALNYGVNQPSRLEQAPTAQYPNRYPHSDYIFTDGSGVNTSFQNQNIRSNEVSVNLSTVNSPAYQHFVPNTSTLFPGPRTNTAVNQNPQTFGNVNARVVNTDSIYSNHAIPFWSLPNNGPQSASVPNPYSTVPVGVGPQVVQNMHTYEGGSGMTSALMNVKSTSTSSFYPPPADPISKITDNELGLYEQVGEIWKCRYEGCGKVIEGGKRSQTRHAGVHAKGEWKLVETGALKLEDAIAIPKAKLSRYECKSLGKEEVEYVRKVEVEEYLIQEDFTDVV
ncbi:hypothetical protein Clacol_005022 [Clathrus columnatus]|uniref:C2H2-type domain-containing protein n=1 Tax=Clathrus columnatus TaxID=1419009 RepID=A0AAV5ADL3_9AGAM|nr:hypothetical protein Clacol_005022 [Clathrus columnatus]